MTFQDITASSGSIDQVNENFDAVAAAGTYGVRAPGVSGLIWGYYGGRGFGNTIADGTVTLTGSTTNYVVANRSTGAVSVATTTTNWNDSTNYYRLYLIVTGGSTITTATDYREFVGGSTSGSSTVSELVNPQTGTTYTYLAGDNNKLVTHTNSSAIAGTLPQAGASCPAGWWMDVQNRGAGTLTITPTTSTIDGASTLALTTGQGVRVVSDGTNYYTQRGMSAGGGSGTVTSVDASGGVEISSGSPITSTGTVRGAYATNPQTGTSYTVVAGDRGKLLTLSNASSIAVTLPQATSTFGAGWFTFVKNLGAGTVTITPTTSTIGGASTLQLTTGQFAMIVSDGTNYNTIFTSTAGAGLTNWTESANSSTPNGTIPAVQFLATNAASNVDAVLSAKGSGATQLDIADNTTTGGNKRGNRALDLQRVRTANTQVASSQDSVVIGVRNTASATGAIAIGDTNSVSSPSYGAAIGGFSNVVSGYAGVAIGGQNNVVDGQRSISLGGQYQSSRGLTGITTFGHAGAIAASAGKRQGELYAWAAGTSSATPTVLTQDGTSSSSTNQPVLANNSCMVIQGQVSARQGSTGDSKGWIFSAMVKRGANAAATALIGTPTVTVLGNDSGASAWTLAIAADTTNGGLALQITGEASKTIAWTGSGIAAYCAA